MATDVNHNKYLLQAQQLLRRAPLIDGHNDFPFIIRGLCQNDLGSANLNHLPIGQTDITRLRQGMVGGQFWSAYVPNPVQPDKESDGPYLECLRQTLQQIDVIHRMINDHPHVFGLAESTADVWNIFHSGRIASLIGIEGLHQIAHSPSTLRMMHRLGVRYATLCHTKNNRYCDSAVDRYTCPPWLECGGQTHDPGDEPPRNVINDTHPLVQKDLISVHDRIIDLSHTSEATQRDAIAISKAPVIFSHSASSSLTPRPRNVTDEILHQLKRNGGLIMVCFLRDLVNNTGDANATRSQVVDHILYAAETIGYDYVGIGSDFDGMLAGPEGMDDVSRFPELVADLFQRGVSEERIEKIVGLNTLRVMKEVEDVAVREQAEGSTGVLCDGIGPMWTPEQRQMLAEQGKKRGLRP
ncbi:hypothetical protein BJX96DRAFT_187401 [Aspergillus floccosus]